MRSLCADKPVVSRSTTTNVVLTIRESAMSWLIVGETGRCACASDDGWSEFTESPCCGTSDVRARFTVRGYNAHGTQRYVTKTGRVIVRVATKCRSVVTDSRLKRVSSVGAMRFHDKTVIDITFWIIGGEIPERLRAINCSHVATFPQRKRVL